MKTYILLTEKPWHFDLFEMLTFKIPANWVLINSKYKFNPENLRQHNPDIIFIPHWSYVIPEQIYSEYTCIVFHMTDLPYGRGGSPLQNLIVRGHKETKISALKVDEGLDTGGIYLKKNLQLDGTAKEIFQRAAAVIGEMIYEIIEDDLKPEEQKGEPVFFKRRTKDQSDISALAEIETAYDYIRMMDCEGYPPAFIETEHFRIEFSNALLETHNSLFAHARIIKK